MILCILWINDEYKVDNVSNTIVTTPRFERKLDLLDKQSSRFILAKLERLINDDVDHLFTQSHKLNNFSDTHLRITKISNDYRLIFRIADKNSIELIDIVSRDDLSKFVKERK